MLKLFCIILKTVPFSVNISVNGSTFSSLLCQQLVKSLSKRRALTFSSCHILLSSFSHLVSAEYEAEGSQGEEKGAKRSEETNRGWSEVGDGNIVKTKYKFLSLSLCVIIPNSKVSNRSYNPFSQLESSVLYLQHDLFWIPLVMFKNNFCPIRTDNRHIIFMSSSDFQYQSCVETYC